jgi:uncharacterized protein
VAERLLLVFAKEPRPGHVKTRLCPPLSAEQAAGCQAAFTIDLLARIRGVAGARIVLCASPDNDSPWLVGRATLAQLDLVWQGSGDLGRRMDRALRGAVDAGAVVVAVGTDSPDLPMAYVEQAFSALEDSELVLGPSDDGGYYLVGCRHRVPPIFDSAIAWGSSAVLEQTLARAAAAGIAAGLLPRWDDVDDAAGLRRFARRVRAASVSGGGAALPACRRLLEDLAREGLEL